MLVVQERAARPADRRSRNASSPGLAAQAGLVLRGARLRAELEQRAAELSARAERAARRRGSAWSTPRTTSAARSSATSTTAPSSTWSPSRSTSGSRRPWPTSSPGPRRPRCSPRRSARRRDAVETAASGSPAASTRRCSPSGGLAAALRGRGRRQPGPGGARRPTASAGYAARLEAAAYFCCLEALQNAAKHAGCQPHPGRSCAGRPTRWSLTRRGRRRRIRPRDASRPEPAWPTCATGWRRVDGTLTDRLAARRGTRIAGRTPAHGGGLTCARGSPGPSPRSPSVCRGRRHRRHRGLPTPVLGGRRSPSTASRSRHAWPCWARRCWARSIVSRYERHADRLAARRGRRAVGALSLLLEAYSIWVRRATAARAGGRSAAVLGLVVEPARRPARDRRCSALMFLLAPDGRLPLAAVAVRRARPSPPGVLLLRGRARCPVDPIDVRHRECRRRAGARGLTFTVGLRPDQRAAWSASLVSMLIRLRRSRGEERSRCRLDRARRGVAGRRADRRPVRRPDPQRRSSRPGRRRCPLLRRLSRSCPLLFAVAVLRYRLYDVERDHQPDRRAGRRAPPSPPSATRPWSCWSARRSTAGPASFWVSLLGTAVVALAFQPLRRAVVRLANRLAYGSRAAALRGALRLQQPAGRDAQRRTTLLPAVAEAAGRAVSAARARRVTHRRCADARGRVGGLGPDRPGADAALRRPGRAAAAVTLGHIHGRSCRRAAAARVRRPSAPGPRRPGRGGVPQRGDGDRSWPTGSPSSTGPPSSWPSPGPASSTPTTRPPRRSRRRSPARCCRGCVALPDRLRARAMAVAVGIARPGLDALVGRHERGAGGAPRADPRGLPHPARQGRAGAGAALAAWAAHGLGRRPAWSTARRAGRRFSPGGGGGLLLLRRRRCTLCRTVVGRARR